MTKIVVQGIRPVIKDNAFANKPKIMYFAGTKCGRIEEAPDTSHGIHGLAITNEPDAWLINLANKTGQHAVDPGPTFNLHSPIVWNPRAEKESERGEAFRELEFGHEEEFFRDRHATQLGTRKIGSTTCNVLSVKADSLEVILFINTNTSKPYQIDVLKDGKLRSSMRYLSYERNLAFQAALFQPPKGIKMAETKNEVHFKE